MDLELDRRDLIYLYSYIKGIVEEKYIDYMVIENNDIGYKIMTSLFTLGKMKLGEKVKVYTSLIVREDEMALCGFATKEELKLYHLLISVSKIGPKGALTILSYKIPGEIAAMILNKDVKSLSKIHGIGAKTAERIVLELKDKVKDLPIDLIPTEEISFLPEEKDPMEEAVEGLMALGYTKKEAEEASLKVMSLGIKDVESIIRKSLTLLMKG